jgi:hypothetical protein
MKTGLEPQYDDIFNNVFSKKTPQAQINAERTDARLNAIKKKFNFNQGNDYTNEKVEREFIEKQAKDGSELDRRQNKRKNLAF